jgi:hypothetical protein
MKKQQPTMFRFVWAAGAAHKDIHTHIHTYIMVMMAADGKLLAFARIVRSFRAQSIMIFAHQFRTRYTKDKERENYHRRRRRLFVCAG